MRSIKEVVGILAARQLSIALPGGRTLAPATWRSAAELENALRNAVMAEPGSEARPLSEQALAELLSALRHALSQGEAPQGGTLRFDDAVWTQIARDDLHYGDGSGGARWFSSGEAVPAVPALGAMRIPGVVDLQSAKLDPQLSAVLDGIQADPASYFALAPRWQDDSRVVAALLERWPRLLPRLADRWTNDKALVEPLIRREPALFAVAGPEVRADPHIARYALEHLAAWSREASLLPLIYAIDPRAFADADFAQWLRSQYTYANLECVRYRLQSEGLAKKVAAISDWRAALTSEPGLFWIAPEAVRKDKALAAIALAHDGWMYALLPDALKRDPELALLAAQHADGVFGILEPSMRKRRDVTLAALHRYDSPGLSSIAPELRTDKEIIALAVPLGTGPSPDVLPEPLRSDRSFARDFMARNPRAYAMFDRALTRDADFWCDVYRKNPRAAKDFPLLGELATLAKADPARYAHLRDGMRRADITCIERFGSVELLERIIADRFPAPGDKRPVVVAAYSRFDHNGAFRVTGESTLGPLLAHHRVVYREVDSAADLVLAVREETATRAADMLIIGGHGVPYGTVLGSANGSSGTLDFGDVAALRGLRGRVRPGGAVVLISCSTGRGTSDDSNLANMLSAVLPEQDIYAPLLPTMFSGYTFTTSGAFAGVRFNSASYVARHGNGRIVGTNHHQLVAAAQTLIEKLRHRASTDAEIAFLTEAMHEMWDNDLSGDDLGTLSGLLLDASERAADRDDWALVWKILSGFLLCLPLLIKALAPSDAKRLYALSQRFYARSHSPVVLPRLLTGDTSKLGTWSWPTVDRATMRFPDDAGREIEQDESKAEGFARTFIASCPVPILTEPLVLDAIRKSWRGRFPHPHGADLLVDAIARLAPTRVETSMRAWRDLLRESPDAARFAPPAVREDFASAQAIVRTPVDPGAFAAPRAAAAAAIEPVSATDRSVLRSRRVWLARDVTALSAARRADQKLLLAILSEAVVCPPFSTDFVASLPHDDAFWTALIAINRNFVRCRPDLAAKAAAHDPLVVDELPLADAVRLLRDNPQLKARYDALWSELKAAGIEFPERHPSIDDLRAVLDARRNIDVPDGRPLAVVIYPKRDHNGSFSIANTRRLMRGYRVLYFEAGSDKEALAALRRAATHQPIKLAVINGHGSADATSLGAADPVNDLGGAHPREELYFDPSDEDEIRQAVGVGVFAKDATLVVDSCATAAPNGVRKDVVETFAAAVKGLRVMGPTVPVAGWLQLDEAGAFVDPGFIAPGGETGHTRVLDGDGKSSLRPLLSID